MPKGIYDRSKSKAERAAEKAGDDSTPSSGSKKGKRTYNRKAASATASGAPEVQASKAHQGQAPGRNSHFDLNIQMNYLGALVGLKTSGHVGLDTNIYNVVCRLEALSEEITPLAKNSSIESDEIEDVEKENKAPPAEDKRTKAAHAAAAVPAPVPFPQAVPAPVPVPTPVPFNGTAQ